MFAQNALKATFTKDGIAAKLQSEAKLAEFLTANDVVFSRDWLNLIKFGHCENIEGNASSARPDFYLQAESARLGAVVLIGNDEYAHRRYPCDMRRTYNIVQALEQTDEFRGAKILYIRFNPHFFKRDSVVHDPPLAESHKLLLSTVRKFDASTLKPGLNLVFVNYDVDSNGNLQLFIQAQEEGNTFGDVLKDCVIKVV